MPIYFVFSTFFSHFKWQIEIVDGNLVCPESGRKFPIKNGIANMLLNEDEVWKGEWVNSADEVKVNYYSR